MFTIKHLMFIILAILPWIQLSILLRYLIKFFLEYLENKPLSWDRNKDRNKTFYTLFFTLTSFLFVIYFFENTSRGWLNYIGPFIFVMTGFILTIIIQFYWNNLPKPMLVNFVTKENDKVEKKANFSSCVTQPYKKEIYKFLSRKEFLNEEFSIEKFENDFLNSPIPLNMEVPEFREFYECLQVKFNKLKKMKPRHVTSLFINNKTGQYYNKRQFSKCPGKASNSTKVLSDFFDGLENQLEH